MRRSKQDAEKTRLKVIDAALTLFSRNGYSNTTLAMIAAEAGYSRGPIYWHFKNKDDLYQAVLAVSQEPLEQLVAEMQVANAQPLQAIEQFICRWLDLLVEDAWFRQSFEILLNKTELTEQMVPTLERERGLTLTIIDGLRNSFVAAQQAAMLPATDSPRRLALLVYSQLMGITQSWLFAPDLFDLAAEKAFFLQHMRRSWLPD
ncbi:TetR family transcriptional regulator [Halopseudomonas salegens]|uniref:Transcriptional regulator, TetR family n=1 Tax=Halopseudomonas salegens TaxID=1434072 RepID=A0A1H2H4V6_9GAMM|nr:TetR family transcriptional regulator [Halopseudomonas salegens]SDU26769.1 transcriptional regulator, TetR family [Halopseudomonas salegens]